MTQLSLENRTTGDMIAVFDLIPVITSASTYLQLDLSSVLPVDELTVEPDYQGYLDALAALTTGARSRLAAREQNANTPISQPVQKRIVARFPAHDEGRIVSTTTDDKGDAVYVVEGTQDVLPTPVPEEQVQGEQDAFAELAALEQFYQRGMSEHALLRKA